MKSDEVIDLLRHYRHDLLNHLQLIKGYAAMKKIDKVQEKIEQTISLSRQEAKLSDLKCPNFALWIIQFNWYFDNFNLSYQVDGENADLSSADKELFTIGKEMMNEVLNHVDPLQLYDTHLHIYTNSSTTIKFKFVGKFNESDSLKRNLLTKTLINEVNILEEEQAYEVVLEI